MTGPIERSGEILVGIAAESPPELLQYLAQID